MPIIIKEDGKTQIVDEVGLAKKLMRFGDILVYENKEYSIPNYKRYIELINFFKTAKSKTEINRNKMKELQRLALQILIWESLN